MRNDLQHLLVERERFGSLKRSRKTALRLGADGEDCDGAFVIASWGRGGYGYWDGKELNENLAPLRRFLEKSVGRSWNKIYSEIREQMDHRRATGLHILQHLKDMVQVHPGEKADTDLFVDPKTGILRKRSRPKPAAANRPVDSVHWRGGAWFKLIECGAKKLWYVVEYELPRPDDVCRLVRYHDADAPRYGLTPGQTRTLYFRDLPELLTKPVEIRRRTPNKKELSILRKLLEQAGARER